MKDVLPVEFIDRLEKILPSSDFLAVKRSFSFVRPITVRVNTLKSDLPHIQELFYRYNIIFEPVPWCACALIIRSVKSGDFGGFDFVTEGLVYRQGLSSMLPVLVLDPQPGDQILDMCAAPGSKTSHMAAILKNEGDIIAIDAVRNRYYKLKRVLAQMGVSPVTLKLMDSRKFRCRGRLFDRILLDAPCSAEGRFSVNDPKTYQYWSLRKIREMAHKQKGLLLNASRLVAPGGLIVYSTCTFAPEENEMVIDWFLRKTEGAFEVKPVNLKEIPSYPSINQWCGHELDFRMRHCLRVLPDELMEGFFIASLVRKR